MRKMNNKGVSMVEVLIALAIFTILMMPIVHGIITSINRTSDAKTLQYRNEYVENVVEYIKQDSMENILSGEYFTSVGSYSDSTEPVVGSATFYKDPNDASIDSSLEQVKKIALSNGWTVDDAKKTALSSIDDSTGDDVFYPYEVYTLGGKVKLGTEHETYSYKVEISNKYYAEKEMMAAANNEVYTNPNNLALGVVEDIDHTKVALINGQIANYDDTVSNAFLTKKIEILKNDDPENYKIYTQQATGAKFFANDKATRIITVEVSGSKTTGYMVRCILKYHDDGKSNTAVANALKDYYIEYVPFVFNYPVDETGVATLPNIYLMYNVCVYNGEFAESDYVAIDTTGLDENTEVNLFIVETAESYSDNILNANESLGILPSNSELYNNNVQTDRERGDVRVHLAATKDSVLKNVHIYHNFDIGSGANADYADTVKNKKNGTILYNSYHSSANDLFDSNFSSFDYVPLMVYGASGDKVVDESVATFASLDAAEQESRGLYEVKVWIVKGDDLDAVDMSDEPIMTATKGGDES